MAAAADDDVVVHGDPERLCCRDEAEPIGDGFHERTIIDHDRFMARLGRKAGA